MAIPEILTSPIFYDQFGIGIFLYLTVVSIWMLRTKKKMRKWMIWTLLGIGLAGLIVDGTLVAKSFDLLSVFG